jgi:hypothetical protein
MLHDRSVYIGCKDSPEMTQVRRVMSMLAGDADGPKGLISKQEEK